MFCFNLRVSHTHTKKIKQTKFLHIRIGKNMLVDLKLQQYYHMMMNIRMCNRGDFQR
ncbi:hypothetical protein C1645_789123 [Glomus cerebriforme]|uniref:Uncharacterized protein n=1 Tax=Glomus cerebriforme TaxID=658196 RepID=A0A397S983_9GLOM|nr:hypothetical protein C1645_789123 [Glomus cerebriforme]